MKNRKGYTLKTIFKLLTVPVFILTLTGYDSLTTENPAAVNAENVLSTSTQNDSLKAVIEFLLTSAATDFYQHQPPVVTAFRKVRVGHLVIDNGQKRYVLCGEFLA